MLKPRSLLTALTSIWPAGPSCVLTTGSAFIMKAKRPLTPPPSMGQSAMAALLLLSLGAFFLTPSPAWSQPQGTIMGTVLDDATGLPLAGANVVIGSSPAAVTD